MPCDPNVVNIRVQDDHLTRSLFFFSPAVAFAPILETKGNFQLGQRPFDSLRATTNHPTRVCSTKRFAASIDRLETLKQNNDVAQVENRLAVCGFAPPTDFSTFRAALPERRPLPWSGSQSGCQAPLRRLTESLQPIDSPREQQLASRHRRPRSPPHPTHRFGMFALSLVAV